MGNKEYNIVLKKVHLDEGLTLQDISKMYSLLSGVQAIPIEVQTEACVGIGFINLTDAEFMKYDYKELTQFLYDKLSVFETSTGEYEFYQACGYSTVLIYEEGF